MEAALPECYRSHSEFVGRWQYGSRPSEYRIVRNEAGALILVDQKKSGAVFGTLKLLDEWLQAELSPMDRDLASSSSVGTIRLRFVEEEGHIVSNFKGAAQTAWGKDTIARRAATDNSSGASILNPELRVGADGIGRLPGFMPMQAAELTARAIHAFMMLNMGSPVMTQITGGRWEVFLTGVGSEPFQEFIQHHKFSDEVSRFLQTLKQKLSDLAFANGGKLSEDIVALVGGSEMQVPHLDLKRGQVQVITALTTTAPTLVYDPTAEKPSMGQALELIGVDAQHATAERLNYLMDGGTPLALPVSTLYGHMIPACQEFVPGDTIQIQDGIVHAGPKFEQKPGMLPRIVIFATYQTWDTAPYDVEFQYKLWDWASYSEVPPRVAYERLFETRRVTSAEGMNVCPWVYYRGESAEACKMLCTTSDLDQDTMEALVHAWRGR